MKTIQRDKDRQQGTPFQRFLLSNRPYCEICSGPYPSTQIIRHKGHDTAVCDAHYRAFNQKHSEQQWNKTLDKLQPDGDPFDYLD